MLLKGLVAKPLKSKRPDSVFATKAVTFFLNLGLEA